MKRIALLLSVILTFMTLKAADPDFAYPKTTLDNALKHYNSAIKSPSTTGTTMIKSLLEIAGATAAIDPDSVVRVIPRVERAISAYPDGADKALMLTIKAELLNSIYSRNRWKYDRTETPDEPLPTDITEWNGRQFRTQIDSTMTAAFNMAANSPSANIANYSQVIKADKLTRQFFPTVTSFIAIKATNLISYDNSQNIISPIIDKMITLSTPKSYGAFYWLEKQLETSSDTYSNRQEKRKQLYLENSDCEASGYLLGKFAESYYRSNRKVPDAQWCLQALRDFIKRYPTYWDINSLKNRIAEITTPKVAIDCNTIVSPGEKFTVNLNHSYTHNAGFKIYSISKDSFVKRNIDRSAATVIKNISVNTDSDVADADTTVSVILDKQGYYVIVPTVNQESSKYNNIFFRCLPYLPTLLDNGSSRSIVVADYMTGAPIGGAIVKENVNKESYSLGSTDKSGILSFQPNNPKNKNFTEYSYDITYDNHTFTFFSGERSTGMDWIGQSDEITIITDRNIYHPGDTIKWAAIAYISRRESRLMDNKSLHVEFLDVNHQLIDSVKVTTDGFGHADGQFTAPTEGLTGSFTIRAKVDEKLARFAGERLVEVSDFKLPTFKIGKIDVNRNVPGQGEATLSGQALTYTGMPVVGAKIEAEIWEASWWKWFSPNRKIGIITGTTDSEGRFNLVINDSIASQSTNGYFYADIAVASNDGEVRKTSVSFTLGKQYIIDFSGKTSSVNVNIDKPLQQPFKAYDVNGQEVNIEVRWWLTPANGDHHRENAVASGECSTSKTASIDLSNIGACRWCLSVEPIDSTLADANLNAAELTTYSIARNLLPSDTDIFVPDYTITADPDGKFSLTYGIENDSTYVYCSFGSGKKQVSLNVNRMSKGFHTLDFCLPEGQQNGIIVLFTILNGLHHDIRIPIKRKDNSVLDLEFVTMRDKLTPGASEQLTLRLSDRNGNNLSGAMISTMFNSALNSLSDYTLPNEFYIPRPNTTLDALYVGSIDRAYTWATVKNLRTVNLIIPQFNPSISINDLYRIRIRGTRAGGTVTNILATEDEAYEEVAIVGYASATMNSNMMMKSMATADMEEEDEELFDLPAEPDEIVAPAEGDMTQPVSSDNFEYRKGEVLQAFWMPELTFNSQGECEISFTVPNANTTWSFNAFAWTDDLRTAKLIREFVAAKPVMVQPNLPRFLRTGDKAQVLATVYNNSDSTATIETIVEIFDITTGEVKSQFVSNDEVTAKGSTIVKAEISADGDAAAIGYRVRSTLGRFTDGEQDFIPVIASDSELIESQNFYLNPGDENVEIKIPNGKKMASTLDYTANPAWNVIKELPGLSQSEGWTAPGVVRRLFAAATASGLLKSYPELAEVIKAWSDNPDSKALTSRLAQNDELKAAVLNSTPWVQAAASDSERMARLSLLFDKKAIEKAISSAIASLKKLHRPDGGWSWGDWCNKSSMWSTNMVLQNLGRLNAIGYLPADKDLKDMISKAISYYEVNIPEKAKTDHAFAFIVTLFPDAKIGLRGKQIINASVQEIIGSWKSSSLWDKSIEAQILAANGHKNVAGQIVSSISEFAVTSPDKGVTFPSDNNINDYADFLYTLSRISPDSKLIDGIRQGIIVRQQVTEQLGSVDPTRVIAAFIASGSKWLAPDKWQTDIHLNGKDINIANSEFATGHVVYNLSSSAGGKTLEINRVDSSVPAYGSVISRYSSKSTDVKAKSCDDLSIEKRVTALRDGKWQYVDNVKLGEQVRILLTIKTKRDLEYVTVIDERPASFEPVDQLPGWTWSAGAGFYRENRDASTNLFIDFLRKGTYQITIEMTASVAGEFTSGVATVQSQLAPSITAHSAGSTLVCAE